jgi:hypothetical protein
MQPLNRTKRENGIFDELEGSDWLQMDGRRLETPLSIKLAEN